MWTRAELKERAKACLKKYYWAAFAVSLIFSLVSGFIGGNGNSNSEYYNEAGYGMQLEQIVGNDSNLTLRLGDNLPEQLDAVPGMIGDMPVGGSSLKLGRLALGIATGVMVVILIISLLLLIFVTPVMAVGRNRFYQESRLKGQSAGVGKLFWGFSHHYFNIVSTMFLSGLFIVLGTICCVIPGIYLSYCYYMVPYILAENPDMKPMEALRLSKQMMEGHKLSVFVLELSFFGWLFLGALTCGVGTFFVLPYYDATFAELYAVLRAPFGSILNGFGYPDVVPTGSVGGTYVNAETYYGGTGSFDRTGGGDPETRGTETGGTEAWETEAGGTETRETETRETEVKRSEGGPGRGYYLNGVFHPYSEEENQ